MQFENATGALENQPHNVVHDLIGGQTDGECQMGWMSDPMCAAADPIFWLHHSNIDRLWANWIFLGGGRSNPTDNAWLTQQYLFYNPSGSPVTMQVSDVLDMETQLQYRYDDTPPPVARAPSSRIIGMAPPTSQPPTPPTTVATSQQPIRLTGQSATVAIPLPAAAQAVTARAATPAGGFAAASTGPTPRIYLNVEDIEVTKHPGVIYEVYLNQPPNEAPDPNSAHFVGTVTFFGASHHQGHGGMSHRYDITNLVPALSASGKWDPNQMAVTFVPRGLQPASTPVFGAAPTAAPSQPTPAVQIGRVSLSHR
jgi:tyrosinase